MWQTIPGEQDRPRGRECAPGDSSERAEKSRYESRVKIADLQHPVAQ